MTYQVRVFELLYHRDVVEFNIEELVNRLERSSYGDVVFEFNRDFVIHKSFEETIPMYMSSVKVRGKRIYALEYAYLKNSILTSC